MAIVPYTGADTRGLVGGHSNSEEWNAITRLADNVAAAPIGPGQPVARFAGKQYKQQKQDDKWYRDFDGKRRGRRTDTAASNRGATATISAPRQAEGATLRRES